MEYQASLLSDDMFKKKKMISYATIIIINTFEIRLIKIQISTNNLLNNYV